MSFYVTLPSNSSMEIYPNNVMSDFTTNLTDSIKFNGSWEVALASFTFRQNIEIVVGTLEFSVSARQTIKSFTVDLVAFENDTLGTIFKNLNENLFKSWEIIQNSLGLKNQKIPVFTWTANQNLEISKTAEFDVQLKGVIKKILDFKQIVTPIKIVFSNKFFPDEHVNKNESFFVYLDIIEDQFVGDTRAPLLECVTSKGSRGEAVEVRYTNPHYVNLVKSEINSINIKILDSTGERIRFKNITNVIVKLHFRPKRYE